MSAQTLEELNNDFDKLGNKLNKLILILEDLYLTDSTTDNQKNKLQNSFKKDENLSNQLENNQQQTAKEEKIINKPKRLPIKSPINIQKDQKQTTPKVEKIINKPNKQLIDVENQINNSNKQANKIEKTTKKQNQQPNKEKIKDNKSKKQHNIDEKEERKLNQQPTIEERTRRKSNCQSKKEEKSKNKPNKQTSKPETTINKHNQQPIKEEIIANKQLNIEEKATNNPNKQSTKEEKTDKLNQQFTKNEKTSNKTNKKTNKIERKPKKVERSLQIKKFIDENPFLNFSLIGDIIKDLKSSNKTYQEKQDIILFLVSKFINDDFEFKLESENFFYDDDKENIINRSKLQSFTDSLINQKTNICFSTTYVKWLCKSIVPIFLSEPSLLVLEPPIYICGDIHGHFDDLLTVFEKGGLPPKSTYLFLGDYVDRGNKSVDVICLLFALKILYPKNIYILRGNHESIELNMEHGFCAECEIKLNIEIWKIFNKVFDSIPIAAIVGKQFFCVHGGLCSCLQNINEINKIKRPIYVYDNQILHDVLWTDPTPYCKGWNPNFNRGGNIESWGSDIAECFLKQNKIQYIVRGHEIAKNGYKFPFYPVKNTITVFSASNYGFYGNQAAIMAIDSEKNFSFITWRKNYAL